MGREKAEDNLSPAKGKAQRKRNPSPASVSTQEGANVAGLIWRGDVQWIRLGVCTKGLQVHLLLFNASIYNKYMQVNRIYAIYAIYAIYCIYIILFYFLNMQYMQYNAKHVKSTVISTYITYIAYLSFIAYITYNAYCFIYCIYCTYCIYVICNCTNYLWQCIGVSWHNAAASSKKKLKVTPRRASTSTADLVIEGFKDYEDDAVPRRNKNGLELTLSGRPSIKKNEGNEKYNTRYRSAANQETILGTLLPIGQACALIGTVMLGPDIPLETSGHADRLRILLPRRGRSWRNSRY